MTTLVTGASGFIGSHLVKKLVKNGKNVVSLIHDDPVWTRWLEEALKESVLVRGDVRDFNLLKRIISHYEVDEVYHLAALSVVKHAHKDPINTFDINIMGTVNLLEACRQLDIEKILINSTDKVYGNQKEATVSSKLIPTDPYGTSKICMDVVAQSFAVTYGMTICIPRCCNVYGYDLNNRIIPNTIRACLRRELPIIFKYDVSLRQYIYVDDVVETFVNFLMPHPRSGGTAWIVNVATRDCFNQKEIVLKILEYFPHLQPQYIEKPEMKEIAEQSMIPDYPNLHHPFEEGITLTIKAFRKYWF